MKLKLLSFIIIFATLLLGRGGVAFASTDTALRAIRATSTQSIPTTTTTKIQLNGETYDVDNDFDSTTNYRFTAENTGYYLLTWTVSFTSCSTGSLLSVFPILNGGNGVATSEIHCNVTTEAVVSGSTTVRLNASDYVELFTWHNSTGSRLINFGDGVTNFSVTRLPLYSEAVASSGSSGFALTEEEFWNLENQKAANSTFHLAFGTFLFGTWIFYHKARYQ